MKQPTKIEINQQQIVEFVNIASLACSKLKLAAAALEALQKADMRLPQTTHADWTEGIHQCHATIDIFNMLYEKLPPNVKS